MILGGSFPKLKNDDHKTSSQAIRDPLGRALDDFSVSAINDRELVRNFVGVSCAARTSDLMAKSMEVDEKYRVKILRGVPAFSSFNDDQLRYASDSLEQTTFKKGDIIDEQDQIGNTVIHLFPFLLSMI